MIAQACTSTCFQSLARYLDRPKPHRQALSRVAWTENRNLVCTGSLQKIAWEMTIVARGNERVQKPVCHVSLSWAPEDNPTRDQMTSVADNVVRCLSLSQHQAVFVAHGDEAYRHLHIMANRVHPETRLVQSDYRSYCAIEATLRHAEVQHGFRRVPGHLYQLPGQSPPERSQSLSKGAYKALCRGKALPFQMLVQRVAGRDFADASGWQDLSMRLARNGLSLKAQRSGLIVTDGFEYAKSSSIAPGVSLWRLEERFGEAFDQQRTMERDLSALGHDRTRDCGLGR